jgi:GNAT superfamily N-acetyltransferase
MKPLLSTFYRVRRFFVPNRAASRPVKADGPQPLTYWMLGPMISRFGRQFMGGAHCESHWSLEILGVDPRFQGHGYGRELVEQGLEMARSDPAGDLPGCVMAADGKEWFYQKCGFKELVGYVCDAEDDQGVENPFRRNGVGGGAVLWTR